jgi:hypothetical protein
MLQIGAAAHPITRTSALFSLICALVSLLYGCMYIIRFGTMRKMHKASSFANVGDFVLSCNFGAHFSQEAQKKHNEYLVERLGVTRDGKL